MQGKAPLHNAYIIKPSPPWDPRWLCESSSICILLWLFFRKRKRRLGMSTRYLSSVDTSNESRDCFLTSLTLIYPTVNKWGFFRGQERLGTGFQDIRTEVPAQIWSEGLERAMTTRRNEALRPYGVLSAHRCSMMVSIVHH